MNGRYKNRPGESKDSIGNGEAKELTCMTDGRELRIVCSWRDGVYGLKAGAKGEKLGQL